MSGFLVNRLTTGTITSPASIATTPQSIGDCIKPGRYALKNMLKIIMPAPKIKLAQAEALVVRLEYRPYRNGAKNAPASAPHEMPMSCAMKVTLLLYCTSAITTDIKMNTTIKILSTKSCVFSLIFLQMLPLMKSSVNVEPDAKTKDDSVDMDADSTKTTTTPIKISGSPSSMTGIMES